MELLTRSRREIWVKSTGYAVISSDRIIWTCEMIVLETSVAQCKTIQSVCHTLARVPICKCIRDQGSDKQQTRQQGIKKLINFLCAARLILFLHSKDSSYEVELEMNLFFYQTGSFLERKLSKTGRMS